MMEIEDNSEKQKKLYFMTEQLNEFHSKLNSYEIQSRIPLENLSLMANILVEDPNIFEIVKGLRDLQNATERILKQRRNELIGSQQKEIEEYTKTLSESELVHTVGLIKIQHDRKIKEMDMEIVKQLDNSVLEQQQTLAALNIPGFYETSENKSVTTQMHLFHFLLRLQKMLETQK